MHFEQLHQEGTRDLQQHRRVETELRAGIGRDNRTVVLVRSCCRINVPQLFRQQPNVVVSRKFNLVVVTLSLRQNCVNSEVDLNSEEG